MSEQTRELAELIGSERLICESLRGKWKPDTDLNAMREVWDVLKERRLFNHFTVVYAEIFEENKEAIDGVFGKGWLDCDPKWESDYYLDIEFLCHFLNDLPGQVTAAIKVLKGGE